MHDIKTIRENPDAFDKALARRGLEPMAAQLLALDEQARDGKTQMQNLLARRNEVAKQIGVAMRSDPAAAEALKKEAAELKEKIAALESGDEEGGALADALMRIPNLLADDVPVGADETANKEVARHGDIPKFATTPLDHVAIGERLGLMDFEGAAKISGARFVVLKGQLARLERALAAFMLDLHTSEFGYTEVNPPVLVKAPALYGTGQLPKFEEDLFKASIIDFDNFWDDFTKHQQELLGKTASLPSGELKLFMQLHKHNWKNKLFSGEYSRNYYLIPTSEVSLTNLVADDILNPDALPLRFTAHTPCFRSEAGSAGKDTRGMIRQHQFSKVELVSITTPEDSHSEHERMRACAEEVLKRLKLPYRVMLLCAGDTGFGARKTYDLEVWLPGQNTYREISSCSNCGDFQARRMKARMKHAGDKETRFVHTLNGSGLAVGRTLVAVLENYQQPDGSVKVPDALVPYMGGVTVIGA